MQTNGCAYRSMEDMKILGDSVGGVFLGHIGRHGIEQMIASYAVEKRGRMLAGIKPRSP